MNIGRVLLTLPVLAFAWAAALNGLDRVSDRDPAVQRAVLEPFRAEAHRSAAAISLAQRDLDGALGHARQAVAIDPIDPDSSALLGTALLLGGDSDGAERAFRVAAKFGWRNFATQAYWFEAALSVGDYELAADRVDALLRAHPQLANEGPLLQRFEETPQGRQVLARRLQRNPPWLRNYLAMTRDVTVDELDRRYSVVRAAAASSDALACEDISTMARVLLDNARRQQAVALWNETCPQKVASAIADPSFAHVLPPKSEALPFAWQLRSSGDLSVGEPADGKGLALSLSSGGTRLVMTQPVALDPGRYRFRLISESTKANNPPRLLVSWGCNRQPPYPQPGEPGSDAQIVTIRDCARQQLAIWLQGRGAVQLRGIQYESVGS